MNPQTLNAINAGMEAAWQSLGWAATLLAGLLSCGFILICLGGLLWQLAAETWQGLQHFHVIPSTVFGIIGHRTGHRSRRALRVLLVCGGVATAALARQPT